MYLGIYGSGSLHEVLNIEVIQSIPGWRGLSGALSHSRRHLQTYLIFTLTLVLHVCIFLSIYRNILPVLLALLQWQGSLAWPWASSAPRQLVPQPYIDKTERWTSSKIKLFCHLMVVWGTPKGLIVRQYPVMSRRIITGMDLSGLLTMVKLGYIPMKGVAPIGMV